MNAVAIIPARGGSKRIPRKNVKNFNGKPIISWSIEVAQAVGLFDQIIVSTDDLEIKSIAESCGAEVPFLRPPELSDDHTGTIPVVAHAIERLEEMKHHFLYACCIYPAAPFIQPGLLIETFQQLKQSSCDYVIPVSNFDYPIQRALSLAIDGSIQMKAQEFFETRSQDLEPAFHDVGQFYWGKTETWLKKTPFFSGSARAFQISRSFVQDIDTHEDWALAEDMAAIKELNRCQP